MKFEPGWQEIDGQRVFGITHDSCTTKTMRCAFFDVLSINYPCNECINTPEDVALVMLIPEADYPRYLELKLLGEFE